MRTHRWLLSVVYVAHEFRLDLSGVYYSYHIYLSASPSSEKFTVANGVGQPATGSDEEAGAQAFAFAAEEARANLEKLAQTYPNAKVMEYIKDASNPKWRIRT